MRIENFDEQPLRKVQEFNREWDCVHPGFCEFGDCCKTAINFYATPDNKGVLLCPAHQPKQKAQ